MRVVVCVSRIDVNVAVDIVLARDASDGTARSLEASTVAGNEIDTGKIPAVKLINHQ
jgi:hypothetical protein